MDCFSCKQQFNDKERCPRLLINCGHSLCESCIISKLQNMLIVCPECNSMNYADSINVMPKNIALLNVKRHNNVTVTVLKNSPYTKRLQNEDDAPLESSDNNCAKHSKKFEETGKQQNESNSNLKESNRIFQHIQNECFNLNSNNINARKINAVNFRQLTNIFEYKKAFCMNDKILLCINCILEDNHKNHELESIMNAKSVEMKIVEKYVAKSELLKQKIMASINNIYENISQTTKITEKSVVEITQFYNRIRSIINEREEKQKNKIKEQMDKEESNLNIQQKSLQSLLHKISDHSTHFKDLSNQNPILFLKSSNMRKQQMQETTIDETSLNVNLQIPTKFDFNKEREVQSLVKILSSYLKHEANKQQKDNQNNNQNNSSNNNNYQQQAYNQKALKVNTNILTQTSQQQSAVANNQATAGQNAQSNKQNKLHSSQNSKKDIKSQKSNHYNQKDKDSQASNSIHGQAQTTQKKMLQTDSSSHSQKTKKSFNILEDLKSEEQLDEKLGNMNSTAGAKQSVFNKPLNNYQEMRNQLKEKLTSDRDYNKSVGRDDSNYLSSAGTSSKKDSGKQQSNEVKSKRSPTSMISLVNTPMPAPAQANSQNQHPKTVGAIQLSIQSNLTGRGNLQTPAHTNYGSSSLSNSKNLLSPAGTTASSSKIQSKISPKQETSKKQESKQKSINLDFASLQKNPQDLIGKKIPTQTETNNNNNNNANESCEMSEICCDINEKNEGQQEHVVNNSFKGEINNFFYESSQLNKMITPNLTMIPQQSSQTAETPLSAFNSSNNYGIQKLNTYGSETNDIYYNKLNDFSSVQNSTQFIYVFGGFTENQQYTIDRYDLARNTWEQFDIMPIHRSKFCSALQMNGNILMIGGKQDNLRVSTIDEYNPRFKTFLKANLQLTSPRSGFGVVSKNDMIYVIGGNDGYSILDTMEVYDFVLQQIKQLPKMLEKRDELAVTQGLDGKIYAIGGFGGETNSCLNSAERYNPVYQQWEKIAPLNKQRRALSAVTLPDGIYAIGGFDGNNYISSVEKYDEYLNQWIYVGSMNYSRCTASVLVSQNNQHIFVFGGFDNGPLDSVERFNVLNGSWELLQPMPNKRFMHCSQLIQK